MITQVTIPYPERCPECKTHSGSNLPYLHSSNCSQATINDLRYWLAEGKKWSHHYSDSIGHWFRESQRWELKFRKVKEENNALRKALYPKKS